MKTLRILLIAPIFACAALAADTTTPVVAPTPPAPEKVTPPATQADPATVEAVLKALHFDEMMGKGLGQQKQMIQQMILRTSLPSTPKAEVEAFQRKAIDTAFIGLSPEEVHAVAAHNYGEIFTTDELHAIADFYNSPVGQAFVTKQPQVQQKIMATLRPRVMEAMGKIQQMSRDFAAQQKAKAAEQAAKEAAAKDKASGAPAAPVSATTPATAPATSSKP
jgi:hypothetical protein